MDPVWDMTEYLDFSDNSVWFDQETEKKYTTPTAPSVGVYNDPGDGDCWEISSSNAPALNTGTTATNPTPQYYLTPENPAHVSHGSASPYCENSQTNIGFESLSIQHTQPYDDKTGIIATPNLPATENVAVHIPGNSASDVNSIATEGFSFPTCPTAVQVTSEVDETFGLTYQNLSPVVDSASPSTQVVDEICPGQASQNEVTFAPAVAQISENTNVWNNSGFVVQFVEQSSENVRAVAPSSELQVKLDTVIESSHKTSKKTTVIVQKPSKNISVGKTQSRKRPAQHKVKLHEVDVPYSDEEKEKKRQNAIKARKNREKLAKQKKELSDEVAKLRKLVQVRDATIEFLKQQRQQDRSRAVEFHRSELRRLEEEGRS